MKIVQNAVFRGKRHDNKISKVQILSSNNLVVIAQVPVCALFVYCFIFAPLPVAVVFRCLRR